MIQLIFFEFKNLGSDTHISEVTFKSIFLKKEKTDFAANY